MLGKLMKYEFKSAGRILGPLYLAVLLLAVIFAGSIRGSILADMFYGSNAQSGDLGGFSIAAMVLFLLVCVTTLVVTLAIIISGFYKKLLGDQGYLMFTLPVRTSTHIWNKVITGTVWIVLGSLIATLALLIICFIVAGPSEFWPVFSRRMLDILSLITTKDGPLFFIWIGIIVVGYAEAIMKVYAAISVGHQFDQHRILGSFAAYIVFCVVESLLINLIRSAAGMDFIDNLSPYQLTALIAAGAVILFSIYFCISWRLLKKRLNLQ